MASKTHVIPQCQPSYIPGDDGENQPLLSNIMVTIFKTWSKKIYLCSCDFFENSDRYPSFDILSLRPYGVSKCFESYSNSCRGKAKNSSSAGQHQLQFSGRIQKIPSFLAGYDVRHFCIFKFCLHRLKNSQFYTTNIFLLKKIRRND